MDNQSRGIKSDTNLRNCMYFLLQDLLCNLILKLKISLSLHNCGHGFETVTQIKGLNEMLTNDKEMG